MGEHNNMGLKISTEQHAAVLRGEAVSTNRYIHYPHGVAAKCIWGGYANGPNGPYISSNRGTDWHLGKLDVPQAAVLEIMGRVGATELYEEFMAAVYALVDSGVVMTWRRDLLRLRKEYSPRFFAHGVDVWACTGEIGCPGKGGHSEYWMLFVERDQAPAGMRKMIEWRELMWGRGSERQEELSPIIEGYLRQIGNHSKGADECDKQMGELRAPLVRVSTSGDSKGATHKPGRSRGRVGVCVTAALPGMRPEETMQQLSELNKDPSAWSPDTFRIAEDSPCQSGVGTMYVGTVVCQGKRYDMRIEMTAVGNMFMSFELTTCEGQGTQTWEVEDDGKGGSVLRLEQDWCASSWFARTFAKGAIRGVLECSSHERVQRAKRAILSTRGQTSNDQSTTQQMVTGSCDGALEVSPPPYSAKTEMA